MPQSSVPSRAPSFRQPAVASFPEMLDNLDDTELMGDDLDSLLDGFPEEQARTEVKPDSAAMGCTNNQTVIEITIWNRAENNFISRLSENGRMTLSKSCNCWKDIHECFQICFLFVQP